MHIRYASPAFDGYMVGFAAMVWLAASGWIMERITASLYDVTLAVIKNATVVAAGGF